MRTFLVYNKDTLVPLYTISPADGSLYDGVTELDGNGVTELPEEAAGVPVDQFRVVAGVLYNTGPAPSPWHKWSAESLAWEEDIALTAEYAWETVKRERDAAIVGGFEYAGMVLDSDQTSQARIMGAATQALLDPGVTFAWTLKDNTVASITASDIREIALALGNHVQACFSKGQELREKIYSATSTAEIANVKWESNA